MSSFVEIPKDRLEPETFRRLLEEFVSREGTDYGTQEYTLDQKIAHVSRQLERGEAVIVFDPESETCNIITREQRG